MGQVNEIKGKVVRVRGCFAGPILGLAAWLLAVAPARAVDIEPRSYSNAPAGMNFLVAGYGYSDGGLSTDPSSPLQDASLWISTGFLAYVRTLDLWGKSGKIDVIVPYSDLSGNALVNGTPAERHVSGFNDPRLRLSVNFFGAPALSAKEFAGYRQDLIVGASLQVAPPIGQYDPDRLVNIGTNSWFIKPEVGISKALGAFTLELAAAVFFYTVNDDYFGGRTLEKDPLYSGQAHLIYSFGRGAWVALDGAYDYGGRATIDGVRDKALGNSRVGITLALPVSRSSSIKMFASTGTTTRAGTEYDLFGTAWQYRW
ncbi:transporter [Candidatus Moduliflexota bacterium]